MRKDYIGIKSSRNNLNGKHLTSMLFFTLLFVFTSQNIFAQAEIDVLGNTISIIGDGTNTPNVADGTDFGQVITLTSSPEQIFTIENTGTSDLTVNPSFTSNPAFAITTAAVSPVPAGGSTTIGITFTAPGAFGVVNAQLFITNNDADEGPAYQINLSAESIASAPEIDVLGNTISIIGDGTNTPNVADGTDFGQIVTGTSSAEQFFIIENTGTLPLSVGPSFTTNLPVFSITTLPVSPVPAGGSTTIGITFNAPGSLGVENAQLFITNNDPDEQPVYTINLQGESVPPPPEIDVLGNGISIIGDGTNVPNLGDGTDFGSIAQGTSSIERFFTIQNTGLGPLSVNPSFSSDPIFTITTPAVSPVPAGGSTTIGITFNAPSTLGAQTATIFITNSDSDENPYQINLSGTSVIDTDGDGIADIYDIDDDNDGILDSNEGIVDTDSDGIINSLDLDSDNDGIADVVETGNADSDNDGRIDGFTDADGNGFHDPFDNPELYSSGNAASIGAEADNIGSWVVEPTGVISSISGDISDGGYAIEIETTSGAGVSDTYAEFTFPAVAGTSYIVNWDMKRSSGAVAFGRAFDWQNVDSSPNITPTSLWGSYSFTVVATTTGDITCRFYSSASGINSVEGDKLLIDKISIREPLVQILPDTDVDTFVNYLDLDSDNDGCFDSLEGAGGNTLNDIDVVGSLVAPVDLNGIPGGTLQATNANVIDNSLISPVCDTDGDGIVYTKDIDDDNDGITDSTEGVIDTDGDSIIDALDLDSDNDGIADVVETGNADSDNDGRIDGFTDLDGNGLHDPFDNPELYSSGNAASIGAEADNIGSWVVEPTGVISSISGDISDGSYAIEIETTSGAGVSDTYAEFTFPAVAGTSYIVNWDMKRSSGAVAFGRAFDWQNVDSSPNITPTSLWGSYSFTVVATTTGDITCRFYSSASGINSVEGDKLLIDKISIREPLVQILPDTDVDTFVNYLDLDSDNDGIPDNIEAQTTMAYIGPNSIFDPNGVDTAYTTLLTPIDTDADTNPDYIDLDSDNEGADDTTEAALTLSGSVGNNGLDDNYDSSDDYLDVNGSFDDTQSDNFPDTDNDIAFGGDVDFRDAFFAPDKDGDGVPDIGDLDDDNDGIPDVAETGGQDPSVDGDGDNVPFYLDDDDANPAVGDDDGLIQPGFDLDGDGIANHLDLDADNDGIFDLHEAGHTEMDTDFNGEIDGVPADFGANGLFNAIESDDTSAATITYTLLDSDGDTTIDSLDVDDDNDGVNTVFEVDNTDLDGDPTTGVVIDTDSDTILNYLDTDDDGDSVNTIFEVDNADLDGDPTTGVVIDTDSDSTLNYLDTDDDGDGVNTEFEVDNTDLDGDPSTGVVIDTDLDTILDYLDVDDDGDSINTEFEVDNVDADGDPTTGVIIDSDGDTNPNYLDADDDGDGIDTINENPDPNADGDPLDAEDKDGDGIPNYLDLDSDNDGILDSVELAIDTDGDGVQNYVDLDSDNDGIFDVVEAGHDSFDSNFDGVIDTLISVGTNGLFDALETFPDSGILNPIYDPIDSTTAAGVPAPDGIFDFLELDSDTDGCNDVTEAGYTDGDSDGLLGTSPVATDANGLVTSAIDGYTVPNDTDTNGTFDFQEYSETTNIIIQPVTPPPTLAGGTVNIDVTSNANTYQWEVSTTGIGGPYTPITDDSNYSGTATANLTISNIPLSFDGNFYRVQVSTNNFICDTPLISNAVEVTVLQDNDGDLIPDITDLDDDNDGIPDTDEGGDALDTDGDGVPNRFDLDSDNDGIYDLVESGQIDATNNVVDVNNDGIIDAANAGTVGANGIFDPLENAPDSGVLNNATADSDSDAIVDSNEINADDDGCNDVIEAGFTDPDANGFLGNGTPGAGLVTDANGVVTGQGGYTTPDDNDSNGIYDFQEPGEQVVLSSQPLSQVVVINATANFDVTGTSPVYTWYESTDGGIIWNVMNNGGTNPTVSGANTDTLTLTNVPGSYDGNQYRVVLSSPAYACGGNITSNSALLTVYADFDGDGIGDPVDLDDDNDGIPDTVETGGIDPTFDNDGDGVPVYLDDNDNNISVGNDNGMVEPAFDFDGDGLANHLELDSDNDGIYDTNEAGFTDLDLDNNGVVDGVPADFGANGLLDSLETAPESGLINYTPLDTDSDTRLNFIDRDDDADGVNTQYENPDADSNGDPSDAQDTDSDGTPDYLDIDDDADGVYTSFEGVNPDGDGNPNTGSTRDTDNDTVFNYLDIDDDGDSVNTVFEGVNPDGDGNPSTGATLNTDGDGLLNYLDTDDDGDSIPTIFENPDANNDGDPADAQDTDGDLIPDYLDNDDDDDTILTFFENPDPDGNGDPLDAQDTDGNGVPDYLDNDDDGDGVLTELENPDPNGNGNPADAQDTDGDGTPDYLDVDDDGDGILTLDEDVDGDGDPTNDDSDGDSVPNYLDIDDDNDGIITLTEGPGNVDNDSYPNYLDQDADGDGIPDNVEGQLTLGYVLPAGDSDGNGLDDAYEATPGSGGGIVPVNTDGADNPDYLDSDSDNDNVPDSIEGHNFLAQFDPDVLPSGNDVDGDGLDDAYDGAVGSFLDPNGLTVIDNPATDLPNFDSTDEVNFRDTDDDNDGINTIDEDGDLSGDPIYDDCDEDGNPDYVDIIPCDRIPTGFSPNDDGNNDTLVVPALAQYKDFTMEVYDRWGNIVYEYSNNGREQPLWWDGFSSGTRTINKGEKVPVGTYFYVIEFNQDRIPPRTGWVYVNY